MARKLIAELVLGLRDNLSGKAKQAAKALNEVDKAAAKIGKTAGKDAAQLKLLTQQLDRAGQEAREFAQAMGGSQKWGAGFDKALARLKLTGAELAEIKKSWAALQQQIGASNDSVFRRNLVQRWRNDTLSAITAVRAAREKMDAEDIAGMRAKAREEARLAKQVAREKEREARRADAAERTRLREEAKAHRELAREKLREARRLEAEEKRAHNAQRSRIRQMGSEFRRQAMYAATGATGIYGSAMVTRRAIESGASSVREGARQADAGIDAAGQARISASAYGLASQYPSVTPTTIREYGAAAYNFTGSIDKAIEFLPDLVRARVAIGVAKGTEAADSEINAILKSADIAGLQDQPGRFQALLEGYVKATQVERNQISGQEYLSFFKRAKMSGQGFSDEFLSYAAPTLMQESSGATAGTAAATAFQQMIGGRITKEALSAQQAAGLRDDSGALKDRQLYISDPLAWVDKHLIPHLQKKGIDTDNNEAVIDAITPLFSERNAAQFLGSMVLQRDQLARNKQLYASATGMGAADTAAQSDPFTAFQGMLGAWDRLMAALTGPALKAATPLMIGIADGLGSLASSLEGNSTLAATLAAVAGGLAALGTAAITLHAALGAWGLLGIGVNALSGGARRRGAGGARPFARRHAGGAGGGAGGASGGNKGGVGAPGSGRGMVGLGLTAGLAAGMPLDDKEFADFVTRNHERSRAIDDWLTQKFGSPKIWRDKLLGMFGGSGSDSGDGGLEGITASWPEAAKKAMGDYTAALMLGGGQAEAQAQAIGQRIKDELAVTGHPDVDTGRLEHALSLARQIAAAVSENPMLSAMSGDFGFGAAIIAAAQEASPTAREAGGGIGSDFVAGLKDAGAEAATGIANGLDANQEAIAAAAARAKATIQNQFSGGINVPLNISPGATGGAAVAGAAIGSYAGQKIVEIMSAPTQAWAPKSSEELADLKGRLSATEAEIARIKGATHPSMAGAPNPNLDRLEADAAILRQRISSAGQEAGAEAATGIANGLDANQEAIAAAAARAKATIENQFSGGISVPLNISPGASAAPAPEAPSAPARASGGRALAGSLYRVNELRKEYFRPDQNGTIVPGGSGGSPVSAVFHITGGNADEIVEKVMARLERLSQEAARGVFGDYGLDTA